MKPVPPVTRIGPSRSAIATPFLDQISRQPLVPPRGCSRKRRLRTRQQLAESGDLARAREEGQEVARGSLPRLHAAEGNRLEEADVPPAAGESVRENLVDGGGRRDAALDQRDGLAEH